MGFREDKQARTDHYFKCVFGWKQRVCTGCNGSGYYDMSYTCGDAITCDSCEGTGKETYKPSNWELKRLNLVKRIKRAEHTLYGLKAELRKLDSEPLIKRSD